MRRQTPGWTFREPTLERAGKAMAHRRGLLDRRVLRLGMVVMVLAAGLAGALLVTVQVTRLRTSVAELEDRRECLLARTASLEASWAAATTPATIRRRAGIETGLVVPTAPDYVLLEPAREPTTGGAWRRLLANFSGEAVAAGTAGQSGFLAGAMVSLQPRAAHAATGLAAGR